MPITIRGFIMFMMMLLILFMALFQQPAQAQDASCPPVPGSIKSNEILLCWSNATQNTDGTPIPATGPDALKQTRVQRAQVATTATCSFSTVTETLNVTPDVTRMFFQNMPTFKHCFRLKHIAEDNEESAFTGTLSKNTSPPPSPRPGGPTITIY